MGQWRPVGTAIPDNLASARLTLHWAMQLIGSTGFAFVFPEDDDTHSNFLWDGANSRFRGRALPEGVYVFLDPIAFEFGVVDAEDIERERFPLEGRTLHEAFGELETALSMLQFSGQNLRVPAYDLPDSTIRSGARFERPPEGAGRELATWYSNGNQVLKEFASAQDGASEVRGWPHHFDLATLVELEGDDPESEKSIGVGLSPGDENHNEPYFYVTPWPFPEAAELPELELGSWHTGILSTHSCPRQTFWLQMTRRPRRRISWPKQLRFVASFSLAETNSVTQDTEIPLGGFTLIEPIGVGAMGQVWRGYHVNSADLWL